MIDNKQPGILTNSPSFKKVCQLVKPAVPSSKDLAKYTSILNKNRHLSNQGQLVRNDKYCTNKIE